MFVRENHVWSDVVLVDRTREIDELHRRFRDTLRGIESSNKAEFSVSEIESEDVELYEEPVTESTNHEILVLVHQIDNMLRELFAIKAALPKTTTHGDCRLASLRSGIIALIARTEAHRVRAEKLLSRRF